MVYAVVAIIITRLVVAKRHYLNTFLHPDFHLTDSNSQVTFSTCHIRAILYSCRLYDIITSMEIIKKKF